MNKFLIQSRLSKLSSAKTVWIAYSGGLDSHVLLHSLSDYPANLRAIHIHHGLNPKADEWAIHCSKVCAALNIPLLIEPIRIETPHQNVEALAREKRYAIFSNLLGEDEALLTGHHQDDQAETLLLQLFRGAGLKGLSAMPEKISFAKGDLIRPLLHFSQSELNQYAQTHQLQWIEDDSNHHLHFHRNFLRHQVLPLLQTRWPTLSKTLARSAYHLADAQTLLETFAEQDLKDTLNPDQTLWIPKLLELPIPRQKNVLRYWLDQLGLSMPSYQKLLSIQNTVLNCKSDAMPLVTWEGVEVRRYRNHLYASRPQQSPIKTEEYEWDIRQEIKLDGEILAPKDLIAHGIDLSGIKTLTIRFRQGGERCRLKGHTHSKSLKKLFQEWGIPPWRRASVPLIYQEEKLIAIWGYAVCI